MTDGAVQGGDLPVVVAHWLTSPEGLHAVQAAVEGLDGGADALEVGTRLRRRWGLASERAAAASEAAHARRRARERWRDADELLFTRTALEQASDPAVSAWRARRYAEAEAVTDLCAGAGGDSLALAAAGPSIWAVDVDASRLLLLQHNVGARGADVHPVRADATRPVTTGGCVHADPGRRRGTRRARHLGEYEPPVDKLLTAVGQRPAGVVLSPGVALDDPLLPAGEIEFVQVGAQLVEAVVWTRELARGVPRSATLLPEGEHRAAAADRERLPVGSIGGWLLEVAPAAVRARLHDDIGREVGAHRLAQSRALLTTDTEPVDSPWYRSSAVLAELPLRARNVRDWLRSNAPDRAVTVVLHGVEADVDRWWRDLGRPNRGEDLRVHLVRTDTGGACVVTEGAHP